MNPNEQLYTVDLSKIILMQKFIVQNFNNSNAWIIIYQYTHGNVLNFCMHVHTIVSSVYKKLQN
jgi:hypothetical protein